MKRGVQEEREDRIEALEKWIWKQIERRYRTYSVSKEEVLNRVKEKRSRMDTIIKRKGD